MINKVILVGNVGQDPEIRYTGDVNNGTKVATIRLATTERYRDRNNNPQEHTEWHTINAWRGLADVVEKYVKTGTQLYIEGRIRTRSWEDQTGAKRYATEIQADVLNILGRRQDSQQQGGYTAQAQPKQQPTPQPAPQPVQPTQQKPFAAEEPSDDLPF